MIDRFGNKIQPAQQQASSTVTLYQECNFLLQGYRNDPTEDKAVQISSKGQKLSQNLNDSLMNPKIIPLLNKLIIALYPLCMRSEDTDMPWHLGWICKNLHDRPYLTKKYSTSELDYIDYSRLFFLHYEQVQPTNQGRTVLIYVTCAQAEKLKDLGGPENMEKMRTILEEARKRDGLIQDDYGNQDRYATCEELYSLIYALYSSDTQVQGEASFAVLQRAIFHAYERAKQKVGPKIVKSLATYCADYTIHPLYDPAKDPLDMDKILIYLEAYAKNTCSIVVRLKAEKIRSNLAGKK